MAINDIDTVETWRPIAGYEGLYEISSLGRVKSVEKTLPHKTHGHWHIKERILRPGWSGQKGNQYLAVALHKGNGEQHFLKVHRLVAETFLEPVSGKTFVNHIDCDRSNNSVGNLEWCTPLENTRHAMANGRLEEGNKKRLKAVICNETGERFSSINEAAKHCGIGGANITRNITGRYKTAGGYTWRWA